MSLRIEYHINQSRIISACLVCFILFSGCYDQNSQDKQDLFEDLAQLNWQEVFYDPGTRDWKEYWSLDGLKARVSNTSEGMEFYAGPVMNDHASHSVLWTKKAFTGDVRIEYEYTRLDSATEAVNILYIQATGIGEGGFNRDISLWKEKREVPYMHMYFNHMNLYHISYAAFGAAVEKDNAYIRARRYMPDRGEGLTNTGLLPDYNPEGLFQTGVPHMITVIKEGDDLFMNIRNSRKELLCHWNTSSLPPVTDGRMGLRHMWTRGARYRDISISVRK